MTSMLPGNPVSRVRYIVRALIAMALVTGFAIWMVSRSTGALDRDPHVFAEVPAEAGLITTGAPVRYHGVTVGEISSIDAGTSSSRVTLAIDGSSIDAIPRTVTMRVLPRTFFGDIYVQLLEPPSASGTEPLSDGDEIRIDTSAESMNLYSIYTKLADVLAEVQPEKLNIALTAVATAIGDRGGDIGVMIDDWWQASRTLESTINEFIDATPKFRAVVDGLKRATPAITESLAHATSLSRGIVEKQSQLAAFFTDASGFVGAVDPFVAAQRNNIIKVVDSTGVILSTVAENPQGVTKTVTEATKFGAAGAKLFSTGRFDITAVPTFSQPMPYTGADCPTYQNMRGSQCFGKGTGVGTGPVRAPGEPNRKLVAPRHAAFAPASFSGPPVIDGAAEAPVLRRLETELRVGSAAAHEPASADKPNPATTLMLGPMVRGHEVKVS
ncbi:MCE family protein [Gordonia paraffinivorans]|uniref:MCE family protein n=1 Tax=Gordonia paraffinivorans TaxID=175628 RepID=UPI003FCE6AE7